jgi:hypothetical protein
LGQHRLVQYFIVAKRKTALNPTLQVFARVRAKPPPRRALICRASLA